MKCPFCNEKLQVVDVDSDGFDILGCDDCDWKSENNDDEMEYYF